VPLCIAVSVIGTLTTVRGDWDYSGRPSGLNRRLTVSPHSIYIQRRFSYPRWSGRNHARSAFADIQFCSETIGTESAPKGVTLFHLELQREIQPSPMVSYTLYKYTESIADIQFSSGRPSGLNRRLKASPCSTWNALGGDSDILDGLIYIKTEVSTIPLCSVPVTSE
jgi:hypothetical protein